MNNVLASKLAIGTAQFGMDYGISNIRGKIPQEEIFALLNYALENGIDTLDTASGYGNAEEVIGKFNSFEAKKLKVISKLGKEQAAAPLKHFEKSLSQLKTDKLYAYLLHDFSSFLAMPQVWNELKSIKQAGRVEKIGFSLYHPEEAEKLFELGIDFDIVQVPYNVFDQRFAKVFGILKQRGVEIHVRSVFLQGLFFIDPQKLDRVLGAAGTGHLAPDTLARVREKLISLNRISAESRPKPIPKAALCMNFALLNKNIDKVVIGIDCLDNLKENINNLKYSGDVAGLMHSLLELREDDEQVILPQNWVKR